MTDEDLPLLKLRACRAIDMAAGAARLSYITDVPGQQAVYMAKLDQARAHLAALEVDPGAPPPPYVLAEMSVTGLDHVAACQDIVATGTAWNEVLGPAIEQARRAGKIAVAAAETPEAVQLALEHALQSLAAI